MSGITSHVLDTTLGRPAGNLGVKLCVLEPTGAWRTLAERATNDDGRVLDLLSGATLEPRTYRLTFETGPYLTAQHGRGFYPQVEIVFTVTMPEQHHHVPLLLSPFGYSTYRGS